MRHSSAAGTASHITLVLCTLLHAFTHAYNVALVPLYLMIVADLHLSGVRAASLIVTVYGLVYCLGSYGAGILADRFNRKTLLGVGLIGNAIAIVAMGLTRQYELLVGLGVLAGLFGTLFHPCANALVPAHYPKHPGMAIGLLGMGAGLGFFFGPQYAGWRAESAGWHLWLIADWQRPCIELGLLGIAVGVLFLLLASEARKPAQPPAEPVEDAMLPNRVAIEAIVTDLRGPHAHDHPHLTPALRRRTAAIAMVLGCRDFVGIASISLLSIYLQKAHGHTTKRAGLIVGSMMLLSVLVNPISVYLSPGRRRLPALVLVLLLSAATLVVVPFVSVGWILPVMCVYQAFQMSSYAISDAAMLERTPPSIRGRVVGLFLTLAGTFASLSPWAMGFWTDLLHEQAANPVAYAPIFVTLAAMACLGTLSTPLIAGLERVARAQSPAALTERPGRWPAAEQSESAPPA